MVPKREPSKAAAVRWALQTVIFALIFGFSLFLTAWRLDWWQAWGYLAVFLCGQILIGLHLVPRNPELITERTSVERSAARSWDRPLSGIVGLFGPLLTLLVSGLDERLGWSEEYAGPVLTAGLVLLILGTALIVWTMTTNRFFYGFVRVHEDKGQVVISSGPYRFVRHPGYLSGILAAIGTPLLLGSTWAFIPSGVTLLALLLRTALEDSTLQVELSGYRVYAGRVRYRLLPWIW